MFIVASAAPTASPNSIRIGIACHRFRVCGQRRGRDLPWEEVAWSLPGHGCSVRKVPDDAVIGCVGVLHVGTRGQRGPGEVVVQVRGGSEAFLAWSDEPLAKGTQVLVV